MPAMTKKWALTILLALAAAPAGAQTWQKLSGSRSGVQAAQTVVVRTDAQWRALWSRHAGSQEAPAVDFSKEMVVGVFLGQRRRAGYSVELKVVELPGFCDETGSQPASLLVIYAEKKPQGGSVAAEVVTTPYAFLKVPKRPAVQFERQSAARALEKLRGLAQAPRFD